MEDEGKRPQFGARYLTQDQDVFKHNAWDDVEWDEEQEAMAKKMVEENSSVKVSSEKVAEIEVNASGNWDTFYGIHQNRFFKDRNWLFTEFPELASIKEGQILEVGCGVGNTVFPILETNQSAGLKVCCCDFSSTAINLVKEHPDYSKDNRCEAFVLDITQKNWTTVPFEKESLDAVILLFVLSALDPKDMDNVVANLHTYLKPGGLVLFRDYGRYDLAQLRFKPGKCLKDNFYARGDGTRCYFFTQQNMTDLFKPDLFDVIQCKCDRRLQVNRGKKLKMYRVWVQCKFAKK